MTGRNHRAAWAALLLLASLVPAPAAPPDAAAFDAILDDALKTWRTPGIAAVIVRDDEVIYLKGAGVREIGKADPVTPDTLFGVGSLTKAFTATAMAQLIDDGKMSWDDPVHKHLPTFRLSDPLADRDVTLRDLLCHRTGLAANDLLWRSHRGTWRRASGAWPPWNRVTRSAPPTSTTTWLHRRRIRRGVGVEQLLARLRAEAPARSAGHDRRRLHALGRPQGGRPRQPAPAQRRRQNRGHFVVSRRRAGRAPARSRPACAIWAAGCASSWPAGSSTASGTSPRRPWQRRTRRRW